MEETHLENKIIIWKKEQELILKQWADKGLCYKIMHDKAFKKYWCLNAWFNIPIIIISTLSGAINFSSNNFDQYTNIIIIFSGVMNIVTGILGTISNYLELSKKVEQHRIAILYWDKFTRKIQIELSKHKEDRQNVVIFIKSCADEYDRLIEISPIFSDDIIRWMKNFIETGHVDEINNKFYCYDFICFPCNFIAILLCCRKKNNNNSTIFSDIEKPEILGYVKSITITD